jgi:hypothetical protein
MAPETERPDLTPLRVRLRRLVIAIVLAVGFLLWLTFHLYRQWTAGVIVTP